MLRKPMAGSDLSFLEGASAEVAPRLLGCLLVRQLKGKILIGRIVETEAYAQNDAASHSYKGSTQRTEIMFGSAGYLYVYFTYGMHYCANVVTGKSGDGSAVLIRAVEPLEGIDMMQLNRRGITGGQLTNGPAKFCQAFAITKTLNGHSLFAPPLQLIPQTAILTQNIVQTTRIGISRAQDVAWRFYEKGNQFVSKKV